MRPRWAQWTITVSILVAIASVVGAVFLGSTQVRCVRVDSSGEVVKAMGDECNALDQVVYVELGPDGQVQVSGDETVEFGP